MLRELKFSFFTKSKFQNLISGMNQSVRNCKTKRMIAINNMRNLVFHPYYLKHFYGCLSMPSRIHHAVTTPFILY